MCFTQIVNSNNAGILIIISMMNKIIDKLGD
jgi:hypothetical protein